MFGIINPVISNTAVYSGSLHAMKRQEDFDGVSQVYKNKTYEKRLTCL